MTASEIARELRLSAPTAHRIAKALESQGYLTRDPSTRGYRLGPEVLRLSRIMSETSTATLSPSALAVIANATNETVGLQTRVADRRICTIEHPSPHAERFISGVGQSYSLAAGAAAKAILSLLPDDEVLRLIALGADPGDNPLPPKKLLADVRHARQLGYAISHGETIRGAAAISVPLPWNGIGAISVVSIVGPHDRMTHDVIERGLDAVSRLLGRTRSPAGLNGIDKDGTE